MATTSEDVRVLCFLYFLYFLFLSSQSVCTPSPLFACDTERHPSLSVFQFCNVSLPINQRVEDLISRLNLTEKILFLSAGTGPSVERLGIPHYEWWTEAIHGLVKQGLVTQFTKLIPASTNFPQVILTAASFNVSLFQAVGKAISTEARAMYNFGQAGLTLWAPNVNIFRDPRWGRGQETPGEDPLLSGRYASAFVRGLQERDDGDLEKLKVAASCKHYTAYDLDSWHGIDRFHFDAKVTKQDMEDTFQPPFKSCVLEGHVASIMCSYNAVNGKPTCGDPDLLSGVIRGEWNLDGYIVSDCDSVENMFKYLHYAKTEEEVASISILAGLDLNCGFFTSSHAEGAMEKGLVNESDIDKAIFNNFRTLMRVGFFDGHPKSHLYGGLGPNDVCSPEHEELALDAARQGIVLLKNTRSSLPLSAATIKKLAVIGPNANATIDMIGSYYGFPCKFTTILQGLTARVPTSYAASCVNVTCRKARLHYAKKIAAEADATVLVMGANTDIENEARDRINIRLPGKQQRVVTQVAKASRGTVILVIMAGSGMDITFAKNDEKINSILWVGYPGEVGGAAVAEVVFGQYNPSGRLPMTWYPQSFAEEIPMTIMDMRPNASTGYPGRTYRFYTGEPVYSFGDGLSYTEIKYSLVQAPESVLIHVEESHVGESSSLYASDETCAEISAFDIQFQVQNLGDMRASHTILLFVSPPSVHNAPQKQLVDFKKVALEGKEAITSIFRIEICKHLTIVDEDGRRRIALGEHVFRAGNVEHSIHVEV